MFTVKQIEEAHRNVRSGADFPKYIQEIKDLGVQSFETWVNDSHTEYFGVNDFKTVSEPQYDLLTVSDELNKEKFAQKLKEHQKGETDYMQFCRDCAENGIEKWKVDLDDYTCIYYDKKGGEVLKEIIPQ